MKKLGFIVALFSILVCCVSCNNLSANEIPEGIELIEVEEAMSRIDVIQGMKDQVGLDELLEKSSHIVKIEVAKIQYFKFECTVTNGDNVSKWTQIGTSYEVVIKDVLKGRKIDVNETIKLFTTQAPDNYFSDLVHLQIGNEYIVFLDDFENYSITNASEYCDFSITDEDSGIILCREDNTYIMNDLITNRLIVKRSKYEIDKNLVNTENFFSYEILPEALEFGNWSIIQTTDISSLLIEK